MRWIIVMLLFGPPLPVDGEPAFDTESGCRLYLRSVYGEQMVRVFRLDCQPIQSNQRSASCQPPFSC